MGGEGYWRGCDKGRGTGGGVILGERGTGGV